MSMKNLSVLLFCLLFLVCGGCGSSEEISSDKSKEVEIDVRPLFRPFVLAIDDHGYSLSFVGEDKEGNIECFASSLMSYPLNYSIAASLIEYERLREGKVKLKGYRESNRIQFYYVYSPSLERGIKL